MKNYVAFRKRKNIHALILNTGVSIIKNLNQEKKC